MLDSFLKTRLKQCIIRVSKDTAKAMYNTCFGIVDLTRHLIQEKGFKYVCLGQLTTDPLEKAFGKLRQGSGGTYFVNAQQVTEKLRIDRAKLQLTLNIDVGTAEEVGHMCEN